ncbi:Inner membrane transport permease YbhS [Photobacterium aquimaris]|uniref:Transport permease protein n=1 Tax=Photobacterium aquimaris TaxID=512643 RepID=A0A1Y6KT72_9GAMM|nr:Inner membrane transport permease YbhS [Photobacterium aquimaris]
MCLLQSIKATQVVDVIASYATPQKRQQAIMDGTEKAVLVLPPDFQRRIAKQQVLGQWLVDGSDALISSTIMQLQKMPLTKVIPQRKVQLNNFEVTLYFNPERRSVINMILGLLGGILTMTMILFTSVAIVRKREQGNLELLITTPIQPLELMLAQITPYIFLGILLFIVASLTLGLVISTKASTQLQAMQMTIFILLSSILLSGFMFPYEGMPVVAQWIAEVLPPTHFIRIIRGIVLRGADLVDLWRDILWLIIFTIFGLIVASIRFKKTFD